MAIDPLTPTAPLSAPQNRDAVHPSWHMEGDKVVNDEFFSDFSFWDALDVINPLQHLPIVGAIYRELTGDELKAGPALAGGFLFGGPAGLAGAAVNVVVDKMTGKDMGAHLIALATGDMEEGDTVNPNANVASTGQTGSGSATGAPINLMPANADQWASLAPNSLPLGMDAADIAAATPGVGAGAASVLPAAAAPGPQNLAAAPGVLPLGYQALAPSAAAATTAPAALTPNRAPAALVPAEDVASAVPAASAPAAAASPMSSPPGTLPLGYDVLGSAASGTASPADQETASAAAHTSLTKEAGLTREFKGKSLDDYRKTARPDISRATPVSSARTPLESGVANRALATPAMASAAYGATGQSRVDPSIATRQLQAQALSERAQTSVGDVLSVPKRSDAPSASPTTDRSDAPAAAAASASASGDESMPAWFNNKMMEALRKYERAKGAPSSSTGINA